MRKDNKEKKISEAANIYIRESRLLERIKNIQTNDALSKKTLLDEYILLGEEYGKLLRQAIKITRIGDSNQRKLFSANRQIEKQKEELSRAYKRLDMIARTDALTELSNRRDFLEKFQYEIHRFERSGKPFSVVLGDIDDFKSVNDNCGHDCGDFVLVNIAKMLKASVRKHDVVGRWGGEEFILLLPEAPLAGGKKAAEGIRKKIKTETFFFKKREISLSITMTFGVSEFNGTTGTNIDECIKKADEALYSGKRKGKNCVVALP